MLHSVARWGGTAKAQLQKTSARANRDDALADASGYIGSMNNQIGRCDKVRNDRCKLLENRRSKIDSTTTSLSDDEVQTWRTRSSPISPQRSERKFGVRRFIVAFPVFASRVGHSKIVRVTKETKARKAEMNFRTPKFARLRISRLPERTACEPIERTTSTPLIPSQRFDVFGAAETGRPALLLRTRLRIRGWSDL